MPFGFPPESMFTFTGIPSVARRLCASGLDTGSTPLLEHGSTQGWQIVLQMTAVGFRVNRGTDLFPDPHVIAWARRHNALPR
jgi:hypothetical protein